MKRSARTLLRHFDRGRRGTTADGSPPATASLHEPGPGSGSATTRYDKLTAEQVLAHLDELTPKELAHLGHHERAHQNRVTVVAHIDARLGHEPWPGYDSLDVDGVRFGLDGAEPDRFVAVLAYERAHQNRAGVVLAAQQTPTR